MKLFDLRGFLEKIQWRYIAVITGIMGILFYGLSNDMSISIGTMMMAASFFSYFKLAKGNVFNPLAIVTVFWIGVAGLSNYRFSTDQDKWSLYMFFIVFIAYIMFVLGYMYIYRKKETDKSERKVNVERLYIAINVITLLAIVGFVLEAYVLKMIPLFSSDMAAYQMFHISGVHYFVVNIGIVPALTISYRACGGKRSIWYLNAISFLIPLLIVSRQLLLFSTIVALVNYNTSYKRVTIKQTIIVALAILVSFSMLLNLRNQSTEYIGSVSNIAKHDTNIEKDNKENESSVEINETRNKFVYTITESKIFDKLVQPYMYLTMNFENLRNIVENFNDYKYGTNMLFPVFAFSNTKGYIDYTYKSKYFNNINFNTNTGLADVYYDFGAIGVMIFSFILGMFFSKYTKYGFKNESNKIKNVMYSVTIYCLIFCFFVSWYANATIWFHIIMLFFTYIYCTRDLKLKLKH